MFSSCCNQAKLARYLNDVKGFAHKKCDPKSVPKSGQKVFMICLVCDDWVQGRPEGAAVAVMRTRLRLLFQRHSLKSQTFYPFLLLSMSIWNSLLLYTWEVHPKKVAKTFNIFLNCPGWWWWQKHIWYNFVAKKNKHINVCCKNYICTFLCEGTRGEGVLGNC